MGTWKPPARRTVGEQEEEAKNFAICLTEDSSSNEAGHDA
jgi:hypothetical protein